MKKDELVKLVQESIEEVVNEMLTARSLVKGKKYDWTMGAGPNTITYIGIRRDFPDIKVGSSVGKGFIFQFEDGKYLEIGPMTLGQYVEEIEPEENIWDKNKDYVEDPYEQDLDELSMGLADKASSVAYDKRDSLENNPLDASKALDQARAFKTYVNPELRKELEKIGVAYDKEFKSIDLYFPNSDIVLKVLPDSYKITRGDIHNADPSLLRKVSVIIKKIQADMKTQRKPEEIDESKGTYEEGYKDAKAKYQKLAKAYKKLKEGQLAEAKIGDELDDKYLGAELKDIPADKTALDKIVDKIAAALDYPAEKTIQLLKTIVKQLDKLDESSPLDNPKYDHSTEAFEGEADEDGKITLVNTTRKEHSIKIKDYIYRLVLPSEIKVGDTINLKTVNPPILNRKAKVEHIGMPTILKLIPKSEEQLQESKKPAPKSTKKQPQPKVKPGNKKK